MIGNVFFNSGGKIGVLELDITVREDHGMASDITDSPVEDGTDVTDHIRNQPRSLVMEGQISKTPVNVQHFNPLRYRQAFAKLEKLHSDRTTVTVLTTLKEYKNMGIKQINVIRDSQTSNVIRFVAQLRVVRIIRTGADAIAAEAADALGSEADAGPQSGTPL